MCRSMRKETNEAMYIKFSQYTKLRFLQPWLSD
jgi:hypothetical protein